jgi:cyclohexanecarboxylate-CoA ligase
VEATRTLTADVDRYRAAGAWPDQLISARFESTATRFADACAVVDGEQRITYAQLSSARDGFAGQLRDAGIGAGDVVSVQLPSWWETIAIAQAVFSIGAVLNPLLASYRQRELGFILGEAKPAAVIVPERFRGIDYPEMIRELDGPEHVVITVRATGQSTLKITGHHDGANTPVHPGADDIALLLYTSGTTSNPKGVLHSHNTLLAEAGGVAGTHHISSDDVLMFTMPFGHIGGLLYAVLVPTLIGNRTVLMDTWDPSVAISLIERERVTVQPAMPVFLRGMLAAPNFSAERVSSLRLFPMGGSTMTPRDVADARELLGCVSKRTYGSTEMPTLCTGQDGDTDEQLAATDGRPIGLSEIRIADEHGNPVVSGPGEILCRGPELFLGYFDQRFNAGAITADGWLRTGDQGVLDETGHLTVVGRLKDIIIRGGENISPLAIEEALLDHPSISAAAVVGMPDPTYGERVCAFVQSSDTEFTFQVMIDHLRRYGLASFQLPEQLVVKNELPYGATAKLDKAAIRVEAAGLRARTPDQTQRR